MPLRLTLVGVLCAFPFLTTSAAAAPADHRPSARAAHPQRAERVHAALSAARTRISTHRKATWTCQRSLRRPLYRSNYAERKTHSRAYLRHLTQLWAKRRDGCQEARRDIQRRTLRDFQAGRGTNAWLRAIEQAQRPYPGTSGWLRSCSSTEGAGRNLSIDYWQANHQGSGAGGWLQFMESTFWRMFSAAKAEVESWGYIVPRSASSWYSPLGQALGGAWAVRHGGTGEWSGSGC